MRQSQVAPPHSVGKGAFVSPASASASEGETGSPKGHISIGLLIWYVEDGIEHVVSAIWYILHGILWLGSGTSTFLGAVQY